MTTNPVSSGPKQSPLPKRLQAPRTTSQLSTISVEARSSESPRPLLSQTLRPRSLSTSQPDPFISSATTASSSSTTSTRNSIREDIPGVVDEPSLKSLSNSRSSTPGLSSLTSRKGKEKAIEGVDEVDVKGVMTAGGSATNGLRRLVRQKEEEEGFGLDAPKVDVGVEEFEPPDKSKRSELMVVKRYTPRRYFVLTNAGKTVFTTENQESSEDNLTNLMGVAQALISIFAEEGDKLRCITRGQHKIAFVLKAPLYLFCVSDWGEPEHVLRVHLEYIHLQILSVVSSTQLSRVFQRRSNFDLSRLLEGTENFLHSLIARCQTDFSYLTATLTPLRMAPALRENAAAALMPPSKFNDLLYVLLIAKGHIVTLLRPRKHSIHPSDLHLLLNTLETSTDIRSSESWLPMCFPKFNPAGFVHAYVSYVMDDVGLVFVSADREAFEDLRGWKAIVLEKLEKDNTLAKIKESIPQHPYSVSVVGCPGLRHFVYKSRQHVQITSPEWEDLYQEEGPDRNRLVTLYQQLHDMVHARSGQSAPLRLVYIKTEHEAVLAWVTRPFEMYLAVSPQMNKAGVVGVANNVARWVGAEEAKLFLRDAPVF